jgi:hypothetical protein
MEESIDQETIDKSIYQKYFYKEEIEDFVEQPPFEEKQYIEKDFYED